MISKNSGLAFLMLAAADANAQLQFGIATGSNSAINSLYLDPADIAGCNE